MSRVTDLLGVLLQHAYAGETARAKAVFDYLHGILRCSPIGHTLRRVAIGEIPLVERVDHAFFMGAWTPEDLADARAALSFVERRLELRVPFLLVDRDPRQGAPSYSYVEIDDFGYVRSSFPADGGRTRFGSILVHELVHGALRARHRFFDEGLATYLEWEYLGNPTLDIPEIDRPSLRVLIANRGGVDVGFESFGTTGAKAAHAMAAATVKCLFTSKKLEQVRAWFTWLGGEHDADVSEAFEQIVERSIEDLELDLFGAPASGASVNWARVIEERFLLPDGHDMSSVLRALKSAHLEEELEGALLIKTHITHFRHCHDRTSLDALDVLVPQFAREYSATPEAYVFAIWHEIASWVGSGRKWSSLFIKDKFVAAQALVREGLLTWPEQPDLLLAAAHLELGRLQYASRQTG